jgi:hypothetical protein
VFRLPNALVLFSTTLAMLLIVAGGALPAAAHAVHEHGAGTSTAGVVVAPRAGEPAAEAREHGQPAGHGHASAGMDAPYKAPSQPVDVDCCCASAACHPGATLAAVPVSLPHEASERIAPSPASSREQSIPSGLERPPRSSASA